MLRGDACLKDAGGNFGATNGGGAALAAGLLSSGAAVVLPKDGAAVELEDADVVIALGPDKVGVGDDALVGVLGRDE